MKDQLDSNIEPLVMALNELPGIVAFGSCGGHDKSKTGPADWRQHAPNWYVEFSAVGPEGMDSVAGIAWLARQICLTTDNWYRVGSGLGPPAIVLWLKVKDDDHGSWVLQSTAPSVNSIELFTNQLWRVENDPGYWKRIEKRSLGLSGNPSPRPEGGKEKEKMSEATPNQVLRESEYLSVFWESDEIKALFVRDDTDAKTAEFILAAIADA